MNAMNADKPGAQCFQGQTVVHIIKDSERCECHETKHDKVASIILLVCLVAFIIAAIIADFVDWKKLN